MISTSTAEKCWKGGTTIEQLGKVLFQLLLDVASGKRSRSEQHSYGQKEFVPWQISAIR
ncbi:hypothetical protein LMG27174_06828 [Paraburkholderia rhynchosiae]|uniref:D-galactarate/Altronate dehydratase C-terminal domain-containing protein n=1 Tax=Paraburkholderia rhynchosiae TaxID=487049 RepID=A0A6J5CQZ3_9BURK|nr:hypothetical protein LMG27174_06828 [Paraburkholderia rhynchosiae]